MVAKDRKLLAYPNFSSHFYYFHPHLYYPSFPFLSCSFGLQFSDRNALYFLLLNPISFRKPHQDSQNRCSFCVFWGHIPGIWQFSAVFRPNCLLFFFSGLPSDWLRYVDFFLYSCLRFIFIPGRSIDLIQNKPNIIVQEFSFLDFCEWLDPVKAQAKVWLVWFSSPDIFFCRLSIWIVEKCRDLIGWFLFLLECFVLECLNTPIQQWLPRFCASPEDFVLRLSNSGLFQYFPLSSPSVIFINEGIAKRQIPTIPPDFSIYNRRRGLFYFPTSKTIFISSSKHNLWICSGIWHVEISRFSNFPNFLNFHSLNRSAHYP